MAIFSATKVTAQGHALIAKVLAGETKFNFDIVQAGDGHFNGDPMDLTALVSHRLDGRIVDVREMGQFTELECIITNQALTAFMEFREFGIRADDPDLGSILFAYANAGDNASPMGPFNGVWLHEERFTVRVFTANATNITATIVQSTFATEVAFINTGTGLTAENVQNAIRELAQLFTSQDAAARIRFDNTDTGLESENLQDAISEVARLLNTHIKETVFTGEPHKIRFNKDTGALEIYNGEEWTQITPGGGSSGSATLGVARFGSARFGTR